MNIIDSKQLNTERLELRIPTMNEQHRLWEILVDENMTDEEIQESLNESCQNAGWTWTNWTCMLEDGTQIAF